VPVALAAAVAGAGVASLLAGGKKRVYGKGLAQFLPNDASDLAKNIACAPRARPRPFGLSPPSRVCRFGR
jgi:hypothetical protein